MPLTDDSGSTLAIVSVSHDITPHRELARALKASERHKSAILEALPDMVFVIDYDGVCHDFKGVSDEEPLIPPSEFMGKQIFKLLPESLGIQMMERTRAAIDTGETQSLEYELSSPDRRGHYEARYVKSGDNTCVAVVRNITMRKAMEAELADTNLKLKLEHQQVADTNIALREVLQHVEAECNKIKTQVVDNVDKQIVPLLEKLKRVSDPRSVLVVQQLETELREITSPFTQNLLNQAGNLTRRELQIAKMILSGLHSKEIADLLDISPRTVEKTRQNVRRKLGITNSEVNLINYLEMILGNPVRT
jgi:DNA-binding CsgD family transcriptional regulator/PAS domain-containing protein